MLSPKPTKLKGELYNKIIKQYGSFPTFKKEFEKEIIRLLSEKEKNTLLNLLIKIKS